MRYIQIQNPRSGLFVKIDRQEGRIMQHKKSPGPFKGIGIVKPNSWRRRVILRNANQRGKTTEAPR